MPLSLMLLRNCLITGKSNIFLLRTSSLHIALHSILVNVVVAGPAGGLGGIKIGLGEVPWPEFQVIL